MHWPRWPRRPSCWSCWATCSTTSTTTTRATASSARSSASTACWSSPPCARPTTSRALRTLNETLWAGVADPLGTLTDVVSRRYRQIADVLAGPTLLTLGNVDVLDIWRAGGRRSTAVPGRRGGGARRVPLRFRRGRVRPSRSPGPAHRPRLAAVRPVRRRLCRPGRRTSGRWTCCARTSRPTSTCCATTGCRPGWRCTGPACSSTSTSTARPTRCSATCTSRWRRGPGAAAPSASTSGHFQRTGRPYVLELVGR